MRKSNTTSLLFAVLLLLLVLVSILGYELYNIYVKNTEASRLLTLVETNADNKAISQSARIIQNNNREIIAEFEEIVFSERDLVPFIEEVESLGRGFGLETNITSINREEPEISALKKQEAPELVAGEPQTIHLSLEAKGDWSEALRFLKALESLPYRVMVSEALISKDSDDWSLNIAVSLHSFKI